MSDHGHKFYGNQCLKCGILDHEGTRNVDVIRHCPGGSRFAPTALVEVLANEVRELRALLTPADPGSLPRDVPVLGTTPVVTTSEGGLVTTADRLGDGTHITKTLNVAVTREELERGLEDDSLAHLSPADRESARRLNEALGE